MQLQVVHLQIQKALRAEKFDIANKLVKELLKTNAGDSFGLTALAKLQLQRRQVLQAKQSIAKALQVNNSFAWGHSVYGLVEAKENNHKEATEAFEFALSLNQEDLDVLYEYVSYLVSVRGDMVKAERLIKRRMILEPDSADNHELHGRVLMVSNELADAEAAFRTAVRLDPLNEKAYVGLAKIELFHRKNAFAAVDWIRPALILNPDSSLLRLYFNQAQTDKNGFNGFLWNSGLLYGANVKWNILLAVSMFLVIPLYFFFKDSYPQFTTSWNLVLIGFFLYCVYCWSSRFIMQLLLEKRWLN